MLEVVDFVVELLSGSCKQTNATIKLQTDESVCVCVCACERDLTCPALSDQFAGTSGDRVHGGKTPGHAEAPRGDSAEA